MLKPAEDTPLSTYNLVKACEEAGIPPGVVNLVTGYGETVGAAMTNHPALRLISFTGSTETGRIVASACAERNAICSLEMGGKNAIIVMDDADIDLAVEGAIWGAFGTSGQRCTASSRLVVHKKVYKQFVTKLVENTKALRVGNGADPKTDVGPVINDDAVEKIMSYIRIGRNDDGAKLACGGKRLSRRLRKRSFHRADSLHRRHAGHAYLAGRDFWTSDDRHSGKLARRRDSDRERSSLRTLGSDLHAERQSRFKAMNEMYTGIFYVNASTIGAKFICRSAARKPPAMVIAKQALRCWIFFSNGSRSTLTSAASCNARRSIRSSRPQT